MQFILCYMPLNFRNMNIKKGSIVTYNGEVCEVTRTAFDIMCNLLPLKHKHFGDIKTLPYTHYGVDINKVTIHNSI